MLLAVVQRLVNQTIARSGQQAHLLPLAGRHVALTLLPLRQTLVVSVTAAGLALGRDGVETADCHLQVDHRALSLLKDPNQLGPLLESGAITLRGNATLAADLLRALKACGVTGEEVMATVVGDPLAHLLVRGGRQMAQSAQRHGSQASADVGSWLRDELRLLVARGEWQPVQSAIGDVSRQAGELEQRLRRLLERRA